MVRQNGVQDAPEKAARWQLTVYEPSPAPDWFGRGVTYQIFPDRFRRVSMPDVSHMPGHRWLHRGWNEQPVFLPDEHGQITNRDFFGGSLQGITEKLDYLAGLGVTTLYLNPILRPPATTATTPATIGPSTRCWAQRLTSVPCAPPPISVGCV